MAGLRSERGWSWSALGVHLERDRDARGARGRDATGMRVERGPGALEMRAERECCASGTRIGQIMA